MATAIPTRSRSISEVVEVREEIYPGKFETFQVFAPEVAGKCSPARAPSPTIRVEEGDHVRVFLHHTHTHGFLRTIHFHGVIHPHAMDGVPEITQPAVPPGQTFVDEFVARSAGAFWYRGHVQPDVHVLMGLAGIFLLNGRSFPFTLRDTPALPAPAPER
jgi:FtsP/CotA-like multicopper oxidase with cupredoxin domain